MKKKDWNNLTELSCTKCLKTLDISNFSYSNKETGRRQRNCKECVNKISSKHYFDNKENRTKQILRWKAENKQRVKELDRIWSKENRDRKNAAYARFIEKNPEFDANRRVRKIKAQPNWLTENDLKCIKAIYNKAKEYTKLTGIQFHVDHIIPLRGKNVSGLHVPGNLRITTQTINQSKGNSFNIGDL